MRRESCDGRKKESEYFQRRVDDEQRDSIGPINKDRVKVLVKLGFLLELIALAG